MAIRTAILTVSDMCSQGKRADTSGQTIEDMLPENKFEVCEKTIVPDDYDTITKTLKRFSDELNVEATTAVCNRMAPGFSEILRCESYKKTPNAVLSRGVSGIRNNTLIINLPGSPKAVRECLEIILKVLPHAVEMMRGGGH